jgi:hypothetical protein
MVSFKPGMAEALASIARAAYERIPARMKKGREHKEADEAMQ